MPDPIPPDLIPVIKRDGKIGAEKSAVDFTTGEVILGDPAIFQSNGGDIKNTFKLEPRVTVVHTRQNPELAQSLSSRFPGIFVPGWAGCLAITGNAITIQSLSEPDFDSLLDVCASEIGKIYDSSELLEHLRNVRELGDDAIWPKSLGGLDLKNSLNRALDKASRAMGSSEAVEEHELAHVAFGQTHPHITRFVQRCPGQHNAGAKLSDHTLKIYQSLRVIDELNAVCTEEDPYLYYHRIIETLSAFKAPTGTVQESLFYKSIVDHMSTPDLTNIVEEHLAARLVLLFGRQIIDQNSEEFRLDGNFMFGEGYEAGLEPSEEQVIDFAKRVISEEMRLLESDPGEFFARVNQIKEELRQPVSAFLEHVTTKLKTDPNYYN